MKEKKENMLNVRLDETTNQKLAEYSKQQGSSKSSIVKEALAMYFSKEQAKQLPFTLGKDLFGKVGSGHSDHSTTFKSKLKTKLSEKHAH
ncbi:MAG: ribbon-helix-helix domain-containing protein [Ekhidna sp.]